jgi:aspartyl-tRNA(Asn)/glutamyl-tRNA(Gln) amidotransferase subunit A
MAHRREAVELTSLTLGDAADLVKQRKISPLELTRACLDRIEKVDGRLNSFATLTAESALRQAQDAEEQIGRGDYRGPLHGIPIALKDLYETKGARTTAASKLLADNVPDEDCTVVKKFNTAGAVSLGKLNLQEWALGVTNMTSYFGPARNPWNPNRITGGSSGGSGAALSAELCFGSMGSDTGGSIRVPAALCGIDGLKPTYGRVSTQGVIPLSWSLDHAGPMARRVRDVAMLLQVVAGYDPADPASVDTPTDDYAAHLEEGVRGWRVAVADDDYHGDADPEVLQAVREAAKVFEQLGAKVSKVSFIQAEQARLACRKMLHADAAAFHYERLQATPQDFGPDVLPRLLDGASMPARDYAIARRKQAMWRRELETFFADYDILLMPTTPIVASACDDENALEHARAQLSRFTMALNMAGVPALSIPCGFNSEGLPMGLQIIARHWAEANLLRAGYAYEQATDWHLKRPEL